MALIPCAQCRQPFYASCHDGSCCDALCPYCEYAEMPLPVPRDRGDAPHDHDDGETVGTGAIRPACYHR